MRGEKSPRFAVRPLLLSSLAILFVFLVYAADAQAQYLTFQRYLKRTYEIRGAISLSYEKSWLSGEDSGYSRFVHDYSFGLTGFVVDPRFIIFDVDGTFTQEIYDPGDNVNSYSISGRLSIMNRRAVRGFLRAFPQPIEIRLSHYRTLDFNATNYGISFAYDPFEIPRLHRLIQSRTEGNLQNQQNNNGTSNGQQRRPSTKKYWYPLPIFYVDYNRYSYDADVTTMNTDNFSIRALDKDVHTEYNAEYNLYRYSGTTDFMTQYFLAELNYRNYWKEQQKRIESLNRLYLTDFDGTRALNLNSNTLWDKRLGPNFMDDLSLRGGGSFFTSSDSTSYSVYTTGIYSKYFNPRLSDRVQASVSFGENDSDTVYGIAAYNDVTYQASRVIGLSNRLTLGQNEIGTLYGGGVGLSVNTFVAITANYDFLNAPLSEGRTTTHSFSLDLSGQLYRNLTFRSQNIYVITEVDSNEPTKENRLTLRGDLFWVVSRVSMNLGASYIKLKKTNGDTSDIAATFIYSNITAPVFRGAFLTVNTTYSDDQTRKLLTVHPILTWTYRSVFVSAEYQLDKVLGDNGTTSHRIMVRLTRKFSKTLRRLF